ncbi:MAG TPA: BON domain-containing protein [Actinophytocola sp.]|uniref:BON domain-containing protein n=1 Tax=Actinophytocola sp. TaxID=1872138 RepID=UPI002DB95602|nr:BON domain-containing protein [Actinophytocola sp.]HEU5474974.1 BON domain-containing protein [Actinophytocola sp.]
MTTDQDAPQYRAARLRQALAEDPRTTELGVRVTVRGEHVLLSGQVVSEQRRDELARVLAEIAPNLEIYNDVRVTNAGEPSGREDLR